MDEHVEKKLDESGKDLSEEKPSRYRELRIWPPIVLVIGMILCRYLPTFIQDGPAFMWMVSAFGPALFAFLVWLWWIALSSATWKERLAGVGGIFVIVMVTAFTVDHSMLGPAMTIVTVPIGMASFALGAVFASRLLTFKRTVIALILATLGFGSSVLFRCDGIWGDFSLSIHWRWTKTAEEELLADIENRSKVSFDELEISDLESQLSSAEWPAFRGADRAGIQSGVKIKSDWERNKPEKLWDIAVGPGWSSFSVAGDLLFTQEQRGPMEVVVCYDASSGSEVWTYELESRFYEQLGGAGPRATPTIAEGAIFVQGASGQVMRLNAEDGKLVWMQNLQEIAKRKPPMWGFASSPLVVDGKVIVHAGGEDNLGTIAFDADSGDLAWSAPGGDHSYSSPQLATFGGEEFVLMLTNTGINILTLDKGDVRLEYEWNYSGYRVLQPQTVDDDKLLIPTGVGSGTRLIELKTSGDEWAASDVWTSRYLKPDFNDFVIHEGHIYGFDGSIFTCIDLATGDAKWKGGRYGSGQVLLLADSSLLLVAGEYGEVVLLAAEPSGHKELAKFQALDGKTWNHPVVVGDRLFIRNGEQAACYRLPADKP